MWHPMNKKVQGMKDCNDLELPQCLRFAVRIAHAQKNGSQNIVKSKAMLVEFVGEEVNK